MCVPVCMCLLVSMWVCRFSNVCMSPCVLHVPEAVCMCVFVCVCVPLCAHTRINNCIITSEMVGGGEVLGYSPTLVLVGRRLPQEP